jgi:ABC-2 type transport system ATP-binding protein
MGEATFMAGSPAELYFGIIMNHIIQAKDLSKTFRSRGNRNLLNGIWRPEWKVRTAVNEVSFSIATGEAVAFLGPNGAGKTTTTKMMTGLVSPSSGTIKVLGVNPFDRRADFLRRIGLVMGNRAGLNWDLTARQSFTLYQQIYQLEKKHTNSRVEDLAQLLDVAEHLDTQVRRLSLGERMKLELIGAIIHEPEVLFLDEPTIGLDIIAKKTIREFLRQLHRDGQTLILTSHDMDDIEVVCERVIIINEGQKIYDDALETLILQHRQDRYIRFVFERRPPKEALLKYGEILEAKADSTLICVPSNKMVEVIGTISSLYPVIDMRVESVPLEEVMTELFTRSLA